MTLQATDFDYRKRRQQLSLDDLQPRGRRVSERLRGVILLGGATRRTKLVASVRRSILDLPIAQDSSLLELWLDEIQSFCQTLEVTVDPVRLILDQYSIAPYSAVHRGTCIVERDPLPFRGVGGLLHDLGRDYQDDDLLLVLTANQVPVVPLFDVVIPLLNQHCDLSLSADDNGAVGGAFLISCRSLRQVPAVGFIDFKEQALPRIAAEHSVNVVHCDGAAGRPLRNLKEYISALRERHARRFSPRHRNRIVERADWEPAFAIVESGAHVDAGARIYDSVILRGAQVPAETKIVRSVLRPDVILKSGDQMVDGKIRHDARSH